MNALKVKWTGIRPLLMHNGRGADPDDSYTESIVALTKKKKDMTKADREQLKRLKFEQGLYFDKKLGPVIPADNIERCIQLGAQKSRAGKDVAAAVFASNEVVQVKYDGPRDPQKMYDAGLVLKKLVRIQQNRVVSVRPMIPTGWSLDFTLEWDPTVIESLKDLVQYMVDAGSLIGLGDWRPKFGRFTVNVLT
jgi:hypothetical protein